MASLLIRIGLTLGDVVWMAGAGAALQWLAGKVGLESPWWAWAILVGLAVHMSWTSRRIEDAREALSKQVGAVAEHVIQVKGEIRRS